MVIIDFLVGIFRGFINLIRPFIKVIAIILGIGLPLFIYLAYFAKEPVMDPEIDLELGRQTVRSISADTLGEYPILDPKEYPESYTYLKQLVNELVSGPDVQYRDLFKYDSIQIINRDDVLNAFCTPGGYIYVYTGLIKYLDSPDHLAGVLGHEIAHAELRHSAMGIQKEFGKDRIMDFILLGTPIGITDYIGLKILNDLTNLKYTRKQEANADKFSVGYLSHSRFACDGTAGFFIKLLEEGDDVGIPEFLSDHPDSQSRVDEITKEAKSLDCSTKLSDAGEWNRIKETLPTSPPPKTEESTQ